MEFIKIQNRQTWLDEIYLYHPDSTNYITQWRSFKKQCIEGTWREDFGEYRYMPGPLYFYVNFCRILDVDIVTKSRRSIKPLLRDLEWEMAYMILEARGFSGWIDDNEYTSHTLVAEYEKTKDEKILKKLRTFKSKGIYVYDKCFIDNNVNNELKKYKSPRENIRSLHKKPLGAPLYNNDAKNVMIFGARGGGKSYFVGIGIILHEVIFDGAKYYTEESITSPAEVHCNIGSWESNKSSELCEKIDLCMNAFATDEELGVWKDEITGEDYPMPFFKSMSGSLVPNNAKSPWAHKYQKKVGGRWNTYGSKSKIVHSVYKDNPTAAAGGRYTIMAVEESGLHPSLTLTHNSNIGCTQRDALKFGTMIYIGTSGDIEKVRESRKMFMDPEAYDILSYDDIWENTGKVGFFLPAYYTATEFKDENGNTDVESAIEYYLQRRKKAKDSKDNANYEGELMNYPIKPSEMFLTKKGNILPIGELEEHRADLLKDKNRHLHQIVGELVFDSKQSRGVKFIPDLNKNLKPITEYPTPKHQDTEGALIVYEPPIEEYIKGEVVVPPIYIIGHDPVNSDTLGEGLSFSAIHVLKMPTAIKKYGGNELVATFIGRPHMGRDRVNEILEKLAMWYGNQPRMINFERGGNVKEYFEKKKKLNLLMTQPTTIMSYKSGGASKVLLYGTPMSSYEQKFEGITLLRDWLLEEKGETEDGRLIRNLNMIRDSRLLEEMIAFDFEGNFDSTMAFTECIIGLKEKYNQFSNEALKEKKEDNILSFLNKSLENKRKQLY